MNGMAVIMLAAYFLLGLMMTIPYIYLAGGGDVGNLRISSWILSITSMAIYDLYKRRLLITKVFWALIGYCLLPIFINGFSVVLNAAGMEKLADVVFRHRFTSLVLVPFTLLAGFWIYLFGKDYWHYASDMRVISFVKRWRCLQ